MQTTHPSGPPIQVLLVEDHNMVRRALRDLLTEQGDIVVVGEARMAREGVQQAVRLQPDVVLLDLRLPDASGIDACAEIHALVPATRVLILTSHDDVRAREEAAAAGAAGYVLKDLDPSGLRRAILEVSHGPALAR
jgi:two-component system response regulator DevR